MVDVAVLLDDLAALVVYQPLVEAPADPLRAKVADLLQTNGRANDAASIDLFLNLTPFSARSSNEFGTNISVRDFVARTGLRIRVGKPEELYGFSDFRAEAIMARLEAYHVSTPYPVDHTATRELRALRDRPAFKHLRRFEI